MTLIELLVAIAIIAILAALLIPIFTAKGCRSDEVLNYQKDPYTQTETWEDPSGNKFMKSPDGSVRQIQ